MGIWGHRPQAAQRPLHVSETTKAPSLAAETSCVSSGPSSSTLPCEQQEKRAPAFFPLASGSETPTATDISPCRETELTHGAWAPGCLVSSITESSGSLGSLAHVMP